MKGKPRPVVSGASSFLRLGIVCWLGLVFAWLPAWGGAIPPALRADYQFQNTLASSVAGVPPLSSLGANSFASSVVDGGARTVLNFAANDGLSCAISGLVPSGNYSIVILFSFQQVNGWRRILDFKSGTSDTGLYDVSGDLDFYNVVLGTGGPIAANTFVQVVLTRDFAGNVTGYVNGAQQFQFADTNSLGVIDASGVLQLFRDADPIFPGEASAGSIARLRLYDGSLLPTEVAALDRSPGSFSSTLQFGASAYTNSEGAGSAVLTVTRVGATDGAASVQWQVIGGTATPGADYVGTNGTVNFTPGQTAAILSLPLIDDALVEGNETAVLALTNAVSATLGSPNTTVLTILDNDTNSPATYSIGGRVTNVLGVGVSGVTMNLTGDYPATVSTDPSGFYSIFNLPAGHYVLTPSLPSYQFVPVAASHQPLTNNVVDNFLAFSSNPPLAVVQFVTQSFGQTEGFGPAVLNVQRLGDTTGTITVQWSTGSGSATPGADYVATNGTLIFGPGVTNQSIVINVIDDTLVEPYEYIFVNLDYISGGTFGSNRSAYLFFFDNDYPVTAEFLFGSLTRSESAGTVAITVQRLGDIYQAFSVDWAITGGTATPGVDFTGALSGTLNFAPGDLFKDISFSLVDDSLVESNETVNLQLSNPTNTVLGTVNTSVLTILDNETAALADLAVSKQPDVFTVAISNWVTFTIEVQNNGPSSVGNVQVVDSLSAGWTLVEGSTSTNSSFDAVSRTWTVFSLPVGVSETLTLQASADVVGTLTNSVQVFPPSGIADPNLSNNSSTTVVQVRDHFLVMALSGPHGSLTPAGLFVIQAGGSQMYIALPDPGYEAESWLVNSNLLEQVGQTNLLVDGIYEDTLIEVSFRPIRFNLAVLAGAEGSVDAGGPLTVAPGETRILSAAPDPNYTVDVWSLDDTVVQSGGTNFTLPSISADHRVQVSFRPASFAVTATADLGGSVSPPGTLRYAPGSTVQFLAVPDADHVVDVWLLDGNPAQPGQTSFGITNLQSDHVISVKFRSTLTPPSILQPPQSQAVPATGTATFVVLASGTGPLTYQWFLNSVALPGAVYPTLALFNVAAADAGAYQVAVSNATGWAQSDPASLTIVDSNAPTIVCPSDFIVCAGLASNSQVFFEVSANDNSSGTVTVSCNPPSGSVFPMGRTVVQCTATDGSGNQSACTFNVTVTNCVPNKLTIEWQTNQVVLHWPAAFGDTALVGAGELGGPWTPVPQQPVLINGEWLVSIPVNLVNQFYRLLMNLPRITSVVAKVNGLDTATSCSGTEMKFTAAATQKNCKTLKYLWDFGDGSTSTEQNPKHTYADGGTYLVTLTVFCAEFPLAIRQVQLTVTVVKVDMGITQAQSADPTATEPPQAKEKTDGLLLGVNDDDDDLDSHHDNFDTAITGTAAQKAEDRKDMATLRLARLAPATLAAGKVYVKKLSGAGDVRLFKRADDSLILTTSGATSSTTEAQAAALFTTLKAGQEFYLVEGVTPGELILSLEYTDGTVSCDDQIKITVVKVDMNIKAPKRADPAETQLPDELEETGSLVFAANDNDDDGDSKKDNSDTAITGTAAQKAADRSDMATLILRQLEPKNPPAGKVYLKKLSGTGDVRFFKLADDSLILTTAGATSSTSDAQAAALFTTLSAGEETYLVEGVNPGPLVLALVCQVGNNTWQDKINLTVLKVDMLVDTDRDGAVDEAKDEFAKDTWSKGAGSRGAIVLPNCDKDNTTKSAPDNWIGGDWDGNGTEEAGEKANRKVDEDPDKDDLAPLWLRRFGLDPLPTKLKATLEVKKVPGEIAYFGGVDAKMRLRVFLPTKTSGSDLVIQAGDDSILGPEAGAKVDLDPALLKGTGLLKCGVEGIEFGAQVDIILTATIDGVKVAGDKVRIRVAPYVLNDHSIAVNTGTGVRKVAYVENLGAAANNNKSVRDGLKALTGAAEVDESSIGDRWHQDGYEIGYVKAPYGEMPVVLVSPRAQSKTDPAAPAAEQKRLLKYVHNILLKKNVGVCTKIEGLGSWRTYDSFGNLESRPASGAPGSFFHGKSMLGGIRDFMLAQDVNPEKSVNTDWLSVGHVDEVISFCPDGTHVISGDPEVCWALLLWANQLDGNAAMLQKMNPHGSGAAKVKDVIAGTAHASLANLREFNLEAAGADAHIMLPANLPSIRADLGIAADEPESTPAADLGNAGGAQLTKAGSLAAFFPGTPPKKRLYRITFTAATTYKLEYQEMGAAAWTLDRAGASSTDDEVFTKALCFIFKNWWDVSGGAAKKDDVFTFSSDPLSKTLKVPVIFRKISAGKAANYSNNHPNSVVNGVSVLTPDSWSPKVNYDGTGPRYILEDYMKKIFTLAGYTTVLTGDDRLPYSNNMGSVHCGSNVERKVPAFKWWEK